MTFSLGNKLAFSEGKLTLDDDEKINDFCNKFIVDRALVVKRLEAMQWSRFNKTKRKEERREASKEEEMKKYSDFNWVELAGGKGLDKLKVKSLDKYLQHHMLITALKLRKKEKVMFIQNHIKLANSAPSNLSVNENNAMQVSHADALVGEGYQEAEISDDAREDWSDSDDGEIINFVGNDKGEEEESVISEDCDTDIEMGDNVEDLVTETRSGRIVKSWRCSFY